MKKKKSRIELAREIISNLRHGMNRPLTSAPAQISQAEPTSYAPRIANRSRRTNQLLTSNS